MVALNSTKQNKYVVLKKDHQKQKRSPKTKNITNKKKTVFEHLKLNLHNYKIEVNLILGRRLAKNEAFFIFYFYRSK